MYRNHRSADCLFATTTNDGNAKFHHKIENKVAKKKTEIFIRERLKLSRASLSFPRYILHYIIILTPLIPFRTIQFILVATNKQNKKKKDNNENIWNRRTAKDEAQMRARKREIERERVLESKRRWLSCPNVTIWTIICAKTLTLTADCTRIQNRMVVTKYLLFTAHWTQSSKQNLLYKFIRTAIFLLLTNNIWFRKKRRRSLYGEDEGNHDCVCQRTFQDWLNFNNRNIIYAVV